MPVVGAPATTSSVILDPVTEDATNVELDISSGNYGLTAHSYPTPSVIAQWASSVSTEGARLGTKRHDNRQISITVEVNGLGALQDLEAKLAKLYREGGTLKRIYTDGREIVFDVLVMDGYEPTFDITHHLGDVTTVQFTLTCAPYGLGDWVTLSSHTETTLPSLIFTETGIQGDMPALGKLVITDLTGVQDFQILVWGIESRNYQSASTASLFIEAESSTDHPYSSLAAGPAGASGSGNNTLLDSSLAAGTWQRDINFNGRTNIGSFRMLARVWLPNTNTGTVSVRGGYRWAASPQVFNDPVALDPANCEGKWNLVDLGPIELKPVSVGDQSTVLYCEAQSTVAGDDIYWDCLELVPYDEGSGQAFVVPNTFGSSPLPTGGTAQIDWQDVWAKRSTETFYGRPGRYDGDYLRIPPAGKEGRTLRVYVRAVQYSIEGDWVPIAAGVGFSATHGDGVLADLSAQLSYRPRYLVVPEA